jgi:membrane fusion protein (multidrug efflux system)
LPQPRRLALAASVLALALSACSAEKPKDKGPVQVGFAIVQETTVPLEVELPGRTAPFQQGRCARR